jgi:hypothetical protein
VTPEDHPWVAGYVTRATARLHGDPALLAESAKQWERLGAHFEREYTLQLLKR